MFFLENDAFISHWLRRDAVRDARPCGLVHLSNGRNERAARRPPPLLQARRFNKERIPDTARGHRLLMLLYDSNQSQKCSRSQVFMNAFSSGPEGVASIIRASSLETGSYPAVFVATQNTFNQYAPQLLHRPNIKSSESTWPTSVVSEPQFGELQHVSSIIVCPSVEDRRLGQSPAHTSQLWPVRFTACWGACLHLNFPNMLK